VLALHKAATSNLRKLTVARTSKYNEYLLRQLQTVTSTDQRQAIILSLSNNETMLDLGPAPTSSYSVDVFAAAHRLGEPDQPRPAVVLIAALLLGLAAAKRAGAVALRLGAVQEKRGTGFLPR